ncbi:hypothetical protein D3C85_1398790 [compost metagenome]
MIDREVAVRERIAHLVGEAPRYLRMRSGEICMVLDDVVARSPDDFQVPHHGILRSAIRKVAIERGVVRVVLDVVDGLQDVAQVVRHPQRIAPTHTGTASRST